MARARRDVVVPAIRGAGFAAALAVVVVVAFKALRDAPPRRLDWPLLVPALVAALAWWVLLARGWALLMSGAWTGADASTWCRTQALRYLPGGIWAPASRVAVAGGSARARLAIVAAENLGALCAALAVGGAGLALSGRLAWLPLVLSPLAPALLARVRLLPSRAPATTPNYLAGFAAYAVASVLAQAAVSGWHEPLAVAGAAGIAWGAGLVVVVAPSGIGVREVVYVGLLSGSFGGGDLAAGAVTMRLVTIAAELLVLVASVRLPRRSQPMTG